VLVLITRNVPPLDVDAAVDAAFGATD